MSPGVQRHRSVGKGGRLPLHSQYNAPRKIKYLMLSGMVPLAGTVLAFSAVCGRCISSITTLN